MAKNLIGLDIGSYGIKLVQLKGFGKKTALVKCVAKTFSTVSIQELSPIDRMNLITGDLKKIIKENKITEKRVATAVSGNSVIVRYVKFPKMTPAELDKSIQFEAEPYIPFDIKEVNISTYIIGDIMEENSQKMETVLVAAKKDILQERIDLIEKSGLKAAVIDVDAFALENVNEFNRKGTEEDSETVMLLNIGASTSNINILEKGVSKVVRDLFVAGNSLTNAIQRGMQLDFTTAEKVKKEKGIIISEEGKAMENEDDIQFSMCMLPVLQELVGEIQRSIDYYQSPTEGEMRVEKIILSGGSALLKNIDRYLAKELNIPVEIDDPFKKINSRGAAGNWEEMIPMFSVALGLALRYEGDIKK